MVAPEVIGDVLRVMTLRPDADRADYHCVPDADAAFGERFVEQGDIGGLGDGGHGAGRSVRVLVDGRA
jgi:hypothetical protein